MKTLTPAEHQQPNKPSLPLLERMDDAVGEATTVMGAVLTELLRRTLRGGVSQIGEGLTAFVADQVDATIAERTPALEQSAAEIADRAARTAATELVVDEVRAVEARARASDQQLASRIEETHKHVDQATTATAQELTTRIHQAERSAEQMTRDLAAQIAEAEKRAAESAQAELARQVQELLERSRNSYKALKGRLDTLESTAAMLAKDLLDEQSGRRADVIALKAQAQELVRAQQEHIDRLRALAAELTQANQALTARVTELEKPRGLSWLKFWQKD